MICVLYCVCNPVPEYEKVDEVESLEASDDSGDKDLQTAEFFLLKKIFCEYK